MLQTIPGSETDVDRLDPATQPVAVIEDGVPKRGDPGIEVGERDSLDDPEGGELERDRRAACERLDEQARLKVVLAKQRRDVRNEPTLPAGISQRAQDLSANRNVRLGGHGRKHGLRGSRGLGVFAVSHRVGNRCRAGFRASREQPTRAEL